MEVKLILLTLWFAVGKCEYKLIDMSYRYNENKTMLFPGRVPMEFAIIHRGWYPGTNNTIWTELNEFQMEEHLGTHMDAPAHINNEPGHPRLHEIPIENFIANAVVIDITEKALYNPNAALEVSDIIQWEEKYGFIPDGSILFMNSGWGKYWGDAKKFLGYPDQPDPFQLNFPGIGADCAMWLVKNRKLKGIGVDTVSLDVGNEIMLPSHRILLSADIYGLENVRNLDKLPPIGAKVYAFPINIYDASGGPTRIIAEIDDSKINGKPLPPFNSGNSLCSLYYILSTMILVVHNVAPKF